MRDGHETLAEETVVNSESTFTRITEGSRQQSQRVSTRKTSDVFGHNVSATKLQLVGWENVTKLH